MSDFLTLSSNDYAALLAGSERAIGVLREEARIALKTPFKYPGRGELTLFLTSNGARVRVSEGGQLIRFLEAQGMDLSVDEVISRTVFNAIKQTGARMGQGQIYLEVDAEGVPQALGTFTQALLEIVGLRHCKYKDALVQLNRANAGPSHDSRDSSPPTGL